MLIENRIPASCDTTSGQRNRIQAPADGRPIAPSAHAAFRSLRSGRWLIDPETGLARVIQGKGAFRRFKDELHEEYPHLLPAWYAFRDARSHRRAVEWLADNSLIDDDTAARFLDEHPEPDLLELDFRTC